MNISKVYFYVAFLNVVTLVTLGSANLFADSKLEQNEFSMVANTQKPPLPKDLKKHVNDKMTLEEIKGVLGGYHDELGFGISYLVWYFDDDSCLAITYFSSENDRSKKLHWISSCKTGEFKVPLIPKE